VNSEALDHLSRRCKVMRRLIRDHGPCTLASDNRRTVFESLVRAVAHQQLNGTAAESILRRLRALFPGKRFPSPRELAETSEESLRACGFSRAKIAALRDIAAKTIEGVVPGSRKLGGLSDIEIIERLTEVRGIGRWTVEMLLIFKLGRPDVLPVNDFGVRNGLRLDWRSFRRRRSCLLTAKCGGHMQRRRRGICGGRRMERGSALRSSSST
jgi:DNA-3-methyladenine glycosylase II